MSKHSVKSVDIVEINKRMNDCLLIGIPNDWAHHSHMRRGVIHRDKQSTCQDTRGCRFVVGLF